VTKRIIEPGQNLGKPGRPFTVIVTLKGYFAAKEEDKPQDKASKEDD